MYYKAILGIMYANDMNFGIKHAPDAGLITQPINLQLSVLPLCYDCHAERKREREREREREGREI